VSRSDAPRPPVADFLAHTSDAVRERFVSEKSILGFAEYLEVLDANPAGQARDAARYTRDAFDYYGTETIQRPYGDATRFKLFDAPFDQGRDAVVGHEPVQERIYGLLTDFVREGRVSKLILLNGPNGSAKTSLAQCIIRGLEHYSHQPEGALYTFNWVFPTAKLDRGSIGFGSARGIDQLDSYAHLAEGDVETRIRTETRDHPLLLIPRADRVTLLRGLLGDSVRLPRSLTEGELSPKARQIYDALLKAYQGDLMEVLKHIQVERFYISHRYRRGAVTVDPQMRVDAGARQVTADRSLAALPASLQNLSLYEPMGDLVEANRGIIEYNDLLKRPVEAFKYLLATCERGEVRLDVMTLHVDTVFIGTCNAAHLDEFKGRPDFASFKARIELIQMPYITDYLRERAIYDGLVDSPAIDRPVAPHTSDAAALWAVLTRLERPKGTGLPDALLKVLTGLSPLEKALLFAEGKAPGRLSREIRGSLESVVGELYAETHSELLYEGRIGASPREIKAVLLAAARTEGHTCLSPLSLFAELHELCTQDSVYLFLRRKPDGAYHQPETFIAAVRDWYLDRVEEELNAAMGLVDAQATLDLFSRYIDQVVHAVRREKWLNPLNGQYEAPDERFMRDVEVRFLVEDAGAADFRTGVMHRLAAWRMDNPEGTLQLSEMFSDHIDRLNDAFYAEKKAISDRIKHDILVLLVDGAEALEDDARVRAEETMRALTERYGYHTEAAVEVLGFLLKARPPSE
jgi:serine protein kinase